jgi:hypothetical protein
MIFFILLGAQVYNSFLAYTQLTQFAAEWVAASGLNPWTVLSLMLLTYLVFGCVMESLSMILLTVPIFFPLIMTLDFGLGPEETALWFGVLILIVVELGLITPPVGMNIFIINSMAPGVPMQDTYRGVVPFLIAEVLRVALIVAIPGIALFLPAALLTPHADRSPKPSHRCARPSGRQRRRGSPDGAGLGATTCNYRGGLGSASQVTEQGYTVGALVAVNAVGRVTVGDGPHFWAGGWEHDGEFGGLGLPPHVDEAALAPRSKLDRLASTTLAVVATDAELTKPEARRLAVMAQDGLARAIHPVHTPLDGDIVFALATGRKPLGNAILDMVAIGSAAARCLARAVARGVYEAGRDGRGAPALPAWRDRFAG